jgi:pyruvate/2-oxoglutarate dehydrogenase complex dihydrolipoamide acyltransferase (E2) component
MSAEITMPKLGLTMTAGTIVRWLKAPGERIEVGEPLLEVSTDKISYEVESPVAGTLEQALGAEGEEFAPGAVIGLVAEEHATASFEAHATAVSALDLVGFAYDANAERRALDAPFSSDLPPELPPARRAIFRRMDEVAKLPLAQVETTVCVDALQTLIQRRGDVGWTAFIVFAAARLLVDHPALRTDARTGAPHPSCDVGVAADTARSLIVPVVRDAATRSLRAIQDDIARLAGAAREGRLAASDTGEAAFTVSNVGPQGIERVVPLVDPPQTATLGMGAVARRPAVVTQPNAHYDVVAPAWMLTLVLSFDHRFIDGAPAARFLAALAAALADPGILL